MWPNYTAGQRLTAADLSAGQPLIIYKTTNTDRASSATPIADPDLTATLAANAVYAIEFYLHYAAINAAQFQTNWTVPIGASGNRSAHGLAASVSDSTTGASGGPAGNVRSGVHGFTTAINYGTRNSGSNQCFALEESLITTSSAGACAINWGQGTSSTTATRLAAGSWMRITRIA